MFFCFIFGHLPLCNGPPSPLPSPATYFIPSLLPLPVLLLFPSVLELYQYHPLVLPYVLPTGDCIPHAFLSFSTMCTDVIVSDPTHCTDYGIFLYIAALIVPAAPVVFFFYLNNLNKPYLWKKLFKLATKTPFQQSKAPLMERESGREPPSTTCKSNPAAT